MKVLVACEFSGIVREAFAKRGHDAWSCDLLPTEISGQHIQGDVLNHLNDGWDLIIAHPPCTYLANSGVQHLWTKKGRWEELEKARQFFMIFYNLSGKVAIENPIPHKYAKLPHYSQIIHPYYFGEEADKTTCLWLHGLPPLMASYIYPKGRRYIDKNGHSNGSYWYQILSMKDHSKIRSRTFQGIANAMAEQWG